MDIAKPLLLLEPDEQYRDVGRRDAADAAGLPDRARADGGELLARLIAKARYILIIKIFRQELCLEFLHVRDLLELLLDVALV